MRIAIETLGTRGDVQPYLALARALEARGHHVQLAAPVQFSGMAAQYGVTFAPLPGEFLALLETPEAKAAVAGGQGFSGGFKLLKYIKPMMRALLDTEWDAVRRFAPDLIVYHPKSIASPYMSEALSVPCLLASPLPGFTPTAAFPSPLLPFASLGPLNRASHMLATHASNLLFGKMMRRWRNETLGLAGRSSGHKQIGTLYAYSRHVVPVPQDWDDSVLVSGYWFLDDGGWVMPDDLAAFLRAGDPPVYVGFGSVPGIEPEELAANTIEALARTGKRGLLATGGGAIGVADIPPHIHVIEAAPHSQLFRHVSATVHHGGAGTTGAAVAAGVPTTLCPFFGDQPFWARRVVSLGVGPAPLDRRNLTVEAFASALTAMDDPAMRARARTLGDLVQAENGIDAAVAFIERVVGSSS